MLRTGSKKIVVNAFGGPGPEFSDNPVEQSENAWRASKIALKPTQGLEYQHTKDYADRASAQARKASKKTFADSGDTEPRRIALGANDALSHFEAVNYHSPKGNGGNHQTASDLHSIAWMAHSKVNAKAAKTIDEHKQAEDFHERMGNDFIGDEDVERHRIAAAHHATAAHVLERHGYNSSDDAAADREF